MILERAFRNAAGMIRHAGEWGVSDVIPSNGQLSGFQGGPFGSNESAAMALSTVLSCTKVLHDDMSSMPFRAYTGDPNGARQALAVQPPIIAQPFGPDLPTSAGMGQIVVSRVLRGNAYLWVVTTDASGLPTQVQVLHPDMVQVRRDPIRGKVFRINNVDYGPDQVKHITGMMMPGALAAVDVLTAAGSALELAYHVNRYADSFFTAGGAIPGVIEMPGTGNRQKVREVKDAWAAGHEGIANANKPAVLFGGAKWTQIAVTPEQAQFLATKQYSREELCGIFGVPLYRIMAGIAPQARGGAGEDTIDDDYVKHTLLGIAVSIERVWNQMIPGAAGTWSMFDFDSFLRADAKERADIAQVHRVIGAYTRNEIRAREGDGPLPDGTGGDDPNAPLNSNTSPAGGSSNAPAPGGQDNPGGLHSTEPNLEIHVDARTTVEKGSTVVNTQVDPALPSGTEVTLSADLGDATEILRQIHSGITTLGQPRRVRKVIHRNADGDIDTVEEYEL